MTASVQKVDSVDSTAFKLIWESCKDRVIENQGAVTYEQMLAKFSERGVTIVEGVKDGVITGYIVGPVDLSGIWYLTNAITESPSDFMSYSAEPMHELLRENNIKSVMTWCKESTPMITLVENNLNRPDLYAAGEKVEITEGHYNITVQVL